jgi:hypothetical protein
MTTLTMRYMRGDYVVTGPDIEPVKFKSRREARDWCAQNHRGSPIREIGADAAERTPVVATVAPLGSRQNVAAVMPPSVKRKV